MTSTLEKMKAKTRPVRSSLSWSSKSHTTTCETCFTTKQGVKSKINVKSGRRSGHMKNNYNPLTSVHAVHATYRRSEKQALVFLEAWNCVTPRTLIKEGVSHKIYDPRASNCFFDAIKSMLRGNCPLNVPWLLKTTRKQIY